MIQTLSWVISSLCPSPWSFWQFHTLYSSNMFPSHITINHMDGKKYRIRSLDIKPFDISFKIQFSFLSSSVRPLTTVLGLGKQVARLSLSLNFPMLAAGLLTCDFNITHWIKGRVSKKKGKKEFWTEKTIFLLMVVGKDQPLFQNSHISSAI